MSKLRLSEYLNERKYNKTYSKPIRTVDTIQKVKPPIKTKNPDIQKAIALKLGISAGTVSKIIHIEFEV